MQSKFDLHVHTNASDGSFSPLEVFEIARAKNLKYISITDHGTLEGLKKVMEIPQDDIKIIPGVEFTSGHVNDMIHILGYFRELPDIEFDHYFESNFLREKGLYNRFARNLNMNSRIWRHERIQIRNVMEKIKENNGIAVLAHPGELYLKDPKLEQFLRELIDLGLDGIEIYNGKRDNDRVDFYERLADKYNLLKMSGSDFHDYWDNMGKHRMSKNDMERFLERFQRLKPKKPVKI